MGLLLAWMNGPRPLTRIFGSSACFVLAAVVVSCRTAPPHDGQADTPATRSTPPGDAAVAFGNFDPAAQALLDAGRDADTVAYSDPMSLHRETREDLLSLFSIKEFTEQEKKTIQPEGFLRAM